jgi:mycothiol synthase
MSVQLRVLDHLDPLHTAQVTQLVAAVTTHDGLSPLSEHVWLHVRDGGDAADQHLLAYEDDQLLGYAHLDTTDPIEGPSAELAVMPEHRRHGVGRLLVEHLLTTTGGHLRLWAHGEQAGAADLARAMNFQESRVLWQMRRSLLSPMDALRLPAGIHLRTFDPVHDSSAWLELNARAFAHLPDQANWTIEDLSKRIAEPWFDPAGFILAESDGELCGFNWTKVHGHHHHGHEDIGEIYVIAVDPRFHGQGLGRSLTIAGLEHLRSVGLRQAMLYVDARNTPAIRLYERLGFVRWDTDVCYRHHP